MSFATPPSVDLHTPFFNRFSILNQQPVETEIIEKSHSKDPVACFPAHAFQREKRAFFFQRSQKCNQLLEKYNLYCRNSCSSSKKVWGHLLTPLD